MKTAGIICEYNPFHNGHKYQIDRVKQDFDAAICVMSGSFVQRGEVALFDKWTRAEAALLSGCDLVIELPVRYTLSSAEGFAMGGIELLNSMGVIDAISFGAECPDYERLENLAKLLLSENDLVSGKIKKYLDSGMNYALARHKAYEEEKDIDLLLSGNNILAVEYIKALIKTNSSILAVPLKRKAAEHDSEEVFGEYASAGRIRKLFAEGRDISDFTPYDYSGKTAFFTDKLSDIFRYRLCCEGAEMFSEISGTEPGLAERFVKARNSEKLSDIIDSVKTKRYTRTRLCRIAMSAILNLKGGYKSPEYIRVLGMNDRGKELLFEMKKRAKLPVITKMADFSGNAGEDIFATDIAALCGDKKTDFGRDFLVSPIIL